jgi:hypothetical protein
MRSFLLVLIFLPVIAFSQDDAAGYLPGYVVLNNKDTISGLIKRINEMPYHTLYRKIKFEKDEHSKVQVFTPENVKEFVLLGDARYLSVKIKDDSLKDFLEVIINGYVSYYALSESSLVTDGPSFPGMPGMPGYNMPIPRSTLVTTYSCEALQKKNEGIYDLKKAFHHFKDNMLQYFADDSDLCEKIKTGYYTKKDIQLIVEAYNTFKTPGEPKNTVSLSAKIRVNNCDGQYATITETNAGFKNAETAFTDTMVNYLRTKNITLMPGAIIFRLVIFRNGDAGEVKKSAGGITGEELLQEWLMKAHGLFLPATQNGNITCSYQHLKIVIRDDHTIEPSFF